MQELIEDESKINNSVYFKIKINGTDVTYNIGKRDKNIKKKRMLIFTGKIIENPVFISIFSIFDFSFLIKTNCIN